MFSQISNINSFIKSMALQSKANDRITKSYMYGLDPVAQKQSLIRQKVYYITARLKSGDDLSSSELAYLKENDTDAYKQAVAIANGKEALKQRLKNCRTKQEAEMVRNSAKIGFASAVNSTGANTQVSRLEYIEMNMAAVDNVYKNYVKSDGFFNLPSKPSNVLDIIYYNKKGKRI